MIFIPICRFSAILLNSSRICVFFLHFALLFCFVWDFNSRLSVQKFFDTSSEISNLFLDKFLSLLLLSCPFSGILIIFLLQ